MEQHSSNRRFLGVSAHVLLIIIIFILPEIVMAMIMPHRREFGINNALYIKTAIFIATFYINYFLIINKTLAKSISSRKVFQFVLWNFLVLILALFGCFLVSRFGFRRHPIDLSDWQCVVRILSFLLRDAVMLILTIGLAVALRLSSKWQDIQQQKQELIARQRDSELAGLKSQLNPHFLFNTLNTIYALIAVDSDKAQKAVHQLSAMLRYMLYDDSQEVALSKECNFIENYVALMRTRIANHPINVEISMGAHADTLIPSLLFIPLVENAFKYGTSTSDGTPVEIFIKAEGNTLNCHTRNSFNPAKHEAESENRSSGIGLTNLRRRLALLYGSKASLSTSVNNNIFSARLTIPL